MVMWHRIGLLPPCLLLAGLGGVALAGTEDSPAETLLPEIGWVVRDAATDEAVLELPDGEEARLDLHGDLFMTGSGGLDLTFELNLDGIDYSVAVAPGERVRIFFISTTDPAFRSPEGVAVGHRLREVLDAQGGEIEQERGWACFVCLPSGWAAGLPALGEGGRWIPCGAHDPDTVKISWFFKKRLYC